jgi:hypothetical protein
MPMKGMVTDITLHQTLLAYIRNAWKYKCPSFPLLNVDYILIMLKIEEFGLRGM